MSCLTRLGLLAILLGVAIASGYPQLRNLSDYSYDRINTEKTYFLLHDSGAADFAWASEWTYATVHSNSEKAAMFLWRFRDGSTAYSLLVEHIDHIGKGMGFLLTNRSSNLEDIKRKPIQPLTRNNYPSNSNSGLVR